MTPAHKILAFLLIPTALTGCGGLEVAPTAPNMPQPLIVQFPADVGIRYTDELRKYVHQEERWGSKWQVALGDSHVTLMNQVMKLAFRHSEEVADVKVAESGSLVDLVFEPHIDRYSFITPRDSGGGFFAVTIRYRLDVYAPDGRLADTLTFTGYGGAPATGMSSSKPMIAATQAAMRDAAAKFLVQFPEQKIAGRLRSGAPLVEEKTEAQIAQEGEAVKIEAVAIVDPPEGEGP